MKTCNRCESSKEKRFFSKDKSRGDGLDHHCKSCRANIHTSWRASNKEHLRGYHTAYMREKRKEPEEQVKQRARTLAQKIPLSPSCFSCNSTNGLERHHEDYGKPLEIVTLCKTCHEGVHHAQQ